MRQYISKSFVYRAYLCIYQGQNLSVHVQSFFYFFSFESFFTKNELLYSICQLEISRLNFFQLLSSSPSNFHQPRCQALVPSYKLPQEIFLCQRHKRFTANMSQNYIELTSYKVSLQIKILIWIISESSFYSNQISRITLENIF